MYPKESSVPFRFRRYFAPVAAGVFVCCTVLLATGCVSVKSGNGLAVTPHLRGHVFIASETLLVRRHVSGYDGPWLKNEVFIERASIFKNTPEFAADNAEGYLPTGTRLTCEKVIRVDHWPSGRDAYAMMVADDPQWSSETFYLYLMSVGQQDFFSQDETLRVLNLPLSCARPASTRQESP